MTQKPTLDDLFRNLFPNFDEWKLEMKEMRKEQNEKDRMKFLFLLNTFLHHDKNEISQRDVLFLLQQTQMLHYELCKETINNEHFFKKNTNFDSLIMLLSLKKNHFEDAIENLPKDKIAHTKHQLQTLHYDFEKLYKIGLQGWVFSNKTYTLENLISDIDELKFVRLLKEKEKENYRDYLEMYINLQYKQATKPQKNTYIHLDYYKEESEDCYNIMGFIEDDLKSHALDFEPWSDWLSFFIATDTLKNFSKEDILYHCLWEMSFVSFDEKDIQEEQKELNTLIKDVDDGFE